MSSISALSPNVRRLSLSRLRNLARRTLLFCRDTSDELLRTCLMIFVLQPSADLLSRERALRIAHWCGSLLLRMPTSGKPVRKTMERCFGMSGPEALEAEREYLAQGFYAFTVFRRVLRGREHPDKWTIKEKNDQAVIQLRESGRSFIVATGHFRRESILALHMPRICPGGFAVITLPVPTRSLRPLTIRTRVQFGQLLQVCRYCRPDAKFAYLGDPSIIELVEYLERPGYQVLVAADAIWNKTGRSTHRRPFAGMRDRGFSMGPAVFSRMAQCPIVACATYVEKDGGIVIEWGPAIPPPQRDDVAADLRTTNALLDFLEIAVGKRPTQYVFSIGEERRWNPILNIWEDPKERRFDPVSETRDFETTPN